MANPLFIPIQFAKNGIRNTIQKILQPTQDLEDATWNSGYGQITMIPKEDGGLAPKGQDFNGIFYALSDHVVHRQNGEQILFSDDVVAEYGGYSVGSIVQSDDGVRHYRSLINNNTFNPNSASIANRWEIYAGVGSVPVASSTVSGTTTVINNLNSTAVSSALSAAMGGNLLSRINSVIDQMFGVAQSWVNVTALRVSTGSYTNNTGRPIMISVTVRDSGSSSPLAIYIGGVLVVYFGDLAGSENGYQNITLVVPSGQSYQVNSYSNPITLWTELR